MVPARDQSLNDHSQPRVLAAGLTPAWQQIVTFEKLHWGEVNRAQEVHWCASGKVLNVGLALAALGANAQTIAPLGGTPSTAIADEFAALGAHGCWIPTQPSTRVCTTILDAATQQTTELVENAAPLTTAELSRFLDAYAAEARLAAVVVMTGSLTSGAPADFYQQLMQQTPGQVILDARGPELTAALPLRPLLVKPNREELAKTVGQALTTDAEMLRAMRQLVGQGAQWVLVSQGKETAWLCNEREVYQLQPPRLKQVVNPIGCGDCLAAGIAWGIASGSTMIEAVQRGMAAAADNASKLLPARLDRDKVQREAARIRVTAVRQ